MLNLVNQNKQHIKKHTEILQLMTTQGSYIFATGRKVTWYHVNLFGYINTFIKYTREQSARYRICRQKLGITFSQLPSRY